MTACWPRASALAAAVGIATGRGGRDGVGGAAGGAVDDDELEELLEELLDELELLELELLDDELLDDEMLDVDCDCCCRGRRTNSMTTGRTEPRIIVITCDFGLPTTFTPPILYMASPMAI